MVQVRCSAVAPPLIIMLVIWQWPSLVVVVVLVRVIIYLLHLPAYLVTKHSTHRPEWVSPIHRILCSAIPGGHFRNGAVTATLKIYFPLSTTFHRSTTPFTNDSHHPLQLTHFTYPQHGTATSSIGWAAVAQFREQQGQSETTLMKPQKFGDHWKCAWTLMLIKWWTISEYNLFHPHFHILLLLAHNHHHRRCVSISAIISGREIERTMTVTDKTTGAATNWIQGKWSSTCSVCHWPKR